VIGAGDDDGDGRHRGGVARHHVIASLERSNSPVARKGDLSFSASLFGERRTSLVYFIRSR
jgi:hypothetical protein